MSLTDHYRLACDHPGCPCVFHSGPLEFGGSERQLARFYTLAGRAGWTRLAPAPGPDGTTPPARHYCPRHCAEGGALIF